MNTLSLNHRLPGAIALTTSEGSIEFDTSNVEPHFPYDDGAFDLVTAIDAIEHVIDEEPWLRECARVLRPGGTLVLQVPYAGWTSWWEHLNIYRYMVDVLGIGKTPPETKVIGWHRQYTMADLLALLDLAGLEVRDVRRHSLGLAELPALAHVVIGDGLRGDRTTNQRVIERRAPLERRDAHIPAGPLSRRICITATKGSCQALS